MRVAPQKRALFSPPRLMSPIDLFDPRANKAYITKSSTSCSPTKRRRGLTFNPVRSPRRRHCSRHECPISPLAGPALFDSLPWISQLEAAPERLSVFDTADLSLLTDELSRTQSPCTGPVRRRKAMQRSNPSVPSPIKREFDYFPPSLHELPAYSLFPPEHFPVIPRTPPPREPFVPSEVQFHGLRPRFPPGIDEEWQPSADVASP